MNKGATDQNPNSAWIIELQLSSSARAREQVEKDFVYQGIVEEKQEIGFPLIYDLAMRSGFTLEDFKFNNSLKIRLLELQGQNEEADLITVQQFLENRLSKDMNPFHIVGIKLNNTSELGHRYFINRCMQSLAHQHEAMRGMIQDPENGFLYLCLNNTQRGVLDLHGKSKNNGSFEGRGVQQARKETLDFIIQAYETFQDEVTMMKSPY